MTPRHPLQNLDCFSRNFFSSRWVSSRWVGVTSLCLPFIGRLPFYLPVMPNRFITRITVIAFHKSPPLVSECCGWSVRPRSRGMATPTSSPGSASARHREPQRLRCSSCRYWDCREGHRVAWPCAASIGPYAESLSANTMSQLIEIPARSQVPMLAAPNSVPKLNRSGAPWRQLAPRRAGIKFQINANRRSGGVVR